MTFRKTVLAYLTGWLIVQPLYNRIIKVVRERELDHPSTDTLRYFKRHGDAVVDAMERQRERRRPDSVLVVAAGVEAPGSMLAKADFAFALDSEGHVRTLKDRCGSPFDPSMHLTVHGPPYAPLKGGKGK